jgi:hypothetical protein
VALLLQLLTTLQLTRTFTTEESRSQILCELDHNSIKRVFGPSFFI